MNRETRLKLIAKDLTDILCDRARNPSEYISVLTSMLGIAVAGLSRAKDEDEFGIMLAKSFETTAMIAVSSRQRLREEQTEGGEWVSVH